MSIFSPVSRDTNGVFEAGAQHYSCACVRPVPLGDPVLLNPAGDNVEHLKPWMNRVT